MLGVRLFVLLAVGLPSPTAAMSGVGVIGIDGRTFHKILDGAQPVLVRFGKRWEQPATREFREWAVTVSKSRAQLLVGEVEHHEDKEENDHSLALAKSFGLSEDDIRLILFPRGTPGTYHAYNASMHGSLNEFVLSHDVALEGLVPQLLSEMPSFWDATPDEQGVIVEKLRGLAEGFEGRERREAITFVRVLKHAVLEKGGDHWANNEIRRIRSLMNGLAEAKKQEMGAKITAVEYVKHKMEAKALRLASHGAREL